MLVQVMTSSHRFGQVSTCYIMLGQVWSVEALLGHVRSD
jgi:hypothetical protein